MARSRVFDQGRGSWQVREAGYETQDQSTLNDIFSVWHDTHGHMYMKTWLRMNVMRVTKLPV